MMGARGKFRNIATSRCRLLKKETENNGFYIQLNEKYRECCAAILFNKMNKEDKKNYY